MFTLDSLIVPEAPERITCEVAVRGAATVQGSWLVVIPNESMLVNTFVPPWRNGQVGEVLAELEPNSGEYVRFGSLPRAIRGFAQVQRYVEDVAMPRLTMATQWLAASRRAVWGLRKHDQASVDQYHITAARFHQQFYQQHRHNPRLEDVLRMLDLARSPYTMRGDWVPGRLSTLHWRSMEEVAEYMETIGETHVSAVTLGDVSAYYLDRVAALLEMADACAEQALKANDWESCRTDATARERYAEVFAANSHDLGGIVVRPFGMHVCHQMAEDFLAAEASVVGGGVEVAANALRRIRQAYQLFLLHMRLEKVLYDIALDLRMGVFPTPRGWRRAMDELGQVREELGDDLDRGLRRPTAGRVREHLDKLHDRLLRLTQTREGLVVAKVGLSATVAMF